MYDAAEGRVFTQHPDDSSLYGAAQVHRHHQHLHHHHHQHNEKIKPYVQNDLEGRGGGGGVWRQFKEQHILIYGPLNEVAGTVFFAQTLNIFFFFLYIDVCVYIKKMAYLCTDKPTHLL